MDGEVTDHHTAETAEKIERRSSADSIRYVAGVVEGVVAQVNQPVGERPDPARVAADLMGVKIALDVLADCVDADEEFRPAAGEALAILTDERHTMGERIACACRVLMKAANL